MFSFGISKIKERILIYISIDRLSKNNVSYLQYTLDQFRQLKKSYSLVKL